jgi:hypothetical protein
VTGFLDHVELDHSFDGLFVDGGSLTGAGPSTSPSALEPDLARAGSIRVLVVPGDDALAISAAHAPGAPPTLCRYLGPGTSS